MSVWVSTFLLKWFKKNLGGRGVCVCIENAAISDALI